jgi:hypothetical protein
MKYYILKLSLSTTRLFSFVPFSFFFKWPDFIRVKMFVQYCSFSMIKYEVMIDLIKTSKRKSRSQTKENVVVILHHPIILQKRK